MSAYATHGDHKDYSVPVIDHLLRVSTIGLYKVFIGTFVARVYSTNKPSSMAEPRCMRPWESSTVNVASSDLQASCACAGQQVPDDVTAGYAASSEQTSSEGEIVYRNPANAYKFQNLSLCTMYCVSFMISLIRRYSELPIRLQSNFLCK